MASARIEDAGRAGRPCGSEGRGELDRLVSEIDDQLAKSGVTASKRRTDLPSAPFIVVAHERPRAEPVKLHSPDVHLTRETAIAQQPAEEELLAKPRRRPSERINKPKPRSSESQNEQERPPHEGNDLPCMLSPNDRGRSWTCGWSTAEAGRIAQSTTVT